MNCELEPAIWSRDTGQQILYLTGIKEVRSKPRLHVSVNLLFGVWPPCCALRRRGRRRAYVPTSNTTSHDTHEKINSRVSLSSLIWVWGSAWRPSATGAPL